MLPTLPIPSAAPPQRGSEPPSNADNQGSDAFAHALQRARGEPRPTHANAERALPRKANGAGSQPAHATPARKGNEVSDPGKDAKSDGTTATPPATADEATPIDAAARTP